jgi:WD40 repeat protein
MRQIFKKDEPEWIKIKPMVEDAWSPCLQTLEGHSNSVKSVAFSHDSKLLASVGRPDHQDLGCGDGALQQTLDIGIKIQTILFDDDTYLVAGHGDGALLGSRQQ